MGGVDGIEVVQHAPAPEPAAPPAGAFYYDLADPDCYLVGERILAELPVIAEWQPVHGPQLGHVPSTPAADLAERVAAQGLQPLRLPDRWPSDSELAMRTATYAKQGGKTVAFSLAAFRQAFAGGRDLGDESTVLIAAAACEIHPRAVLSAVNTRSIAARLQATGEEARAAGVTVLPAIVIDGRLFEGPDALDRALDWTAAVSNG